MLTRNITTQVRANGTDIVTVNGSFRPAGTGTPTDLKGSGFSVARISTGLYRVTFSEILNRVLSARAFARKADTTAMLVQGGDYVKADRTLDIRTYVAGGGSALVRAIALDLSSARVATLTKAIQFSIGDFVLGSTPPVRDATLFGWGFDADAEAVRVQARVPADWDGSSDLTFRVRWHPLSGDAIEDTETVKWNLTWGTIAVGEAADNGTEVVATTTRTQSGAGTDKALIETDIVIDHDDAGQPIAAGDLLTFLLQVDATNSTYVAGTGDVVLVGAELRYTALNQPIPTSANLAEGGPYLERTNGATDPTFRIVWPAGNVTAVQFPAFTWPSMLDGTAAATVRLRAGMSGATDTPTIDVQFWESLGDTEAGGVTGALSSSVANVTRSLAASDINDSPSGLPVTLALVPGTHATDAVRVYGAALEYTSTDSPDAFALADLSDDADNEIAFQVVTEESAAFVR